MDPVAIVNGALTDLTGYASGVAPEALAVAIAIFGLGFVWKLARRFVK